MKTKALLTNSQLDKLSDLSIGLRQLLFGSTVVPYIIPSVEKPALIILLFGVGFAIGFWIFAIWIVKGARL